MEYHDYICPDCHSIFSEEEVKGTNMLCPHCYGELEILPMDNYIPCSKIPMVSMADRIKQYGQKETWRMIEKLISPLERLKERQIFFDALRQLNLTFNI